MKKLLLIALICLLLPVVTMALPNVEKQKLPKVGYDPTLPIKENNIFKEHGSKFSNSLQDVPDAFRGDAQNRIMLKRPLFNGQYYEQGGERNYQWTYEPYSQVFIGVSCARYSVADNDNVVHNIGEMVCIKYNPNGIGPIDSTTEDITWWETVLWDTIQPRTGTAGHTKEVNEWFYPTVVAVNPTQSTNFADVKIAISTAFQAYDANSTTGYEKYKWFGFLSGQDVMDSLKASYYTDNEAWNNADGIYSNHRYVGQLKGTGAVIDGTPYAFFYGLAQVPNNSTSPYNYGIIVVDLSNLPAAGADASNLFIKNEFLPQSVINFFSTAALQPGEDGSNDLMPLNIALEVDNNSNVYLAFIAATAVRMSDVNLGGADWTNSKTAVVIKTKFDANEPLLINNPTFDTLPLSAMAQYVAVDKGGLFDPADPNTGYQLGVFSRDDLFEIAFKVIDEDVYTFVMPFWYSLGDIAAYDLIECTKNGTWDINFIQDIVSWYPGNTASSWGPKWNGKRYGTNEMETSWVPAESAAFEPAKYRDRNDDNHTPTFYKDSLSVTSLFSSHNVNLATTTDDDYIIVKWKQIDTTVHHGPGGRTTNDIIIPNQQMNIPFQSSVWQGTTWDTRWYNYTDNRFYKNSLMMAYKRKGTNEAWTVTNATVGIENINFNASYMPKVVKSLDEVFCSFIYFPGRTDASYIQTNEKNAHDMAVAIGPAVSNNYWGYAYADLVILSKDHPWGIEEGEATDFTSLNSAYPNPAINNININFTLAEPAHTTLTITNVLGQPVSVVVDQFCDAREHNANWDVSKFAPGTYYITLRSGDVVKAQMFSVIR